MKRYLPLLLLLPAMALAEPQYKIAAVVNDDMISMLDVEERLRLLVATTGISDSPDVRKRLLPQIVRSLIDESLQLQAAKDAGLTVSRAEVKAAIAAIEKQRGRPAGSLPEYLRERGVSPASFERQLEAQLSWNQFVGRRIGRKLSVSKEEVARAAEQIRNRRKVAEEALISSLLLPVPDPESEAQTLALAKKLAQEVSGGASFEAVARQLSGGGPQVSDTWVELGQLEPSLAAAIGAQGQPGVIGPIRTPAGYQLVMLKQKRSREKGGDAEMMFKEIRLSLDSDANVPEVDVLMSIAQEVARHPGTCPEKGVAGINDFEGLNIDVSFVRTPVSGLSPEVLPLVEDLGIGQISEPFAAPDGLHLLMLCEKVEKPAGVVDTEKLRGQLLQQKLELEATRYLRNLRREAFVEVRL